MFMLEKNNSHQLPLVSVIIPIYNLETTIARTICYLKAQTLVNFEVILINDGSTDHTVQVANKYICGDSRFRCLTQENRGAAAARNHGLKLARSEAIIFLDGDDYYSPFLLEKAYRALVNHNADIVIFNWREFNLKLNRLFSPTNYSQYTSFPAVFSAKDYAETIFQLTIPAPWSKLYRRSFIAKHHLQFDENTGPCNDVYFCLLAQALATKICLINDVLVYYLAQRDGSYTSQFRLNVATDFIETRLKLKQRLEDLQLYQLYEKSFINNFIDSVFFRLYRSQPDAFTSVLLRLKSILDNHEIDLLRDDIHYYTYPHYFQLISTINNLHINQLKKVKDVDELTNASLILKLKKLKHRFSLLIHRKTQ